MPTQQDPGGDRPAMPLNEKDSARTSVKRDPHADNALIDEMQEESLGGGEQGTYGGNLARNVATRDEEKTAYGGTPEPTQVNKSDKINSGTAPHPRDGSDMGGR